MAEEEVFYSATKTCEIICPSGLGISHTVEAGTVISSISQADADARAEAVACRKASLEACSGVILPVGNQAQGISCISGNNLIAFVTLPSNLSISGPTLTVAANSFSAPTLSEANALAAAYVTNYMNAGLDSGELCCDNIFGDLDWGAPSITDTGDGGTSSFTVADENFDLEVTAAPPAGGSRTLDLVGTFVYSGPAVACNLHIEVLNPIQSAISRIIISSSVDGQLHNVRYETAGTFDAPFTVPLSAGATISVSLSIFAIGNDIDPGHNHWIGSVQSCLDPTP